MVGIDLEAAREKDSRRNVAALTLRKRGSLFRMEEWCRSLALCQAFQGLSVLRRMPGLRPTPRDNAPPTMETFALQLEKTKQETTGFRTEPRGKQGGVTFAGMTTSPNP